MQRPLKIIPFLIIFILIIRPAWSLTIYWGIHPDKERLVFQFKNFINYRYKVTVKNNEKKVILTVPSNIISKENIEKDVYNINNTIILYKILFNKKNKFNILTHTKKFSIKYFYLKDENKIVIDFYKLKDNKFNIKKHNNKKINNNISVDLNSTNSLNSNNTLNYASNSSVFNSSSNMSLNFNNNSNILNKKNIVFNSTSKLNNVKNFIKILWNIKGKIDRNATIYNPNTKFLYIKQYISSFNKNEYLEKKNHKGEKYRYQIKKKINEKITLISSSNTNITNSNTNNTELSSNIVQHNKKILSKSNSSSVSPSINNIKNNSQQVKTSNNSTSKVDYEQKMFQIKLQINNGEYDSAIQALQELYNDPNMPMNIRKEVIFTLIDLYMQLYKNKGQLKQNYYKIVSLLKEGIYLFPKSIYKAEALLKLCYLNLIVDNVEEARGYFNLLKDEYPKSSYVAQGYYYWGNYYYKNKDYINAMENYKIVVENYQTSSIVRDAAIKLTRVLYNLQMYQKAWIVMKYLEQRWPLYYQKAPDILKLNGFVAMFNKKYDLALSYYWKYYNIVPDIEKKDADLILTRIGDLYLKKGLKQYAKRMYIYVAKKYPEKEGGLIAKMRLAEEGIYDEPTIKQMFSVFNRPYNLRPVQIYTEIVKKHPDSPLAPLAQLKLSMWYLWNNNYSKCLEAVKIFFARFPDSELKNRAMKIGRIALSSLIKKGVKDGLYSYVLSLWNNYSFLRKDISKIDPEAVIGVAISLWRMGYPSKGLKLAHPYLRKKELNKTGIAALELVLNIYLQTESWKNILQLGKDFLDNKMLSPDVRSQLKYAYALAEINLGMGQEAIPYLRELALDPNITEKQRGDVFYFLARQEMSLQDYQKVYLYSQEALSILLKEKSSFPKISDCFNMLIEVTKNSGRVLEAIEWAERFKKYIPKGYSNWPEFLYNLAGLYHDAGYIDRWKSILKSIKNKYPDSFYGQLAAADLENIKLTQEAKNFLQ